MNIKQEIHAKGHTVYHSAAHIKKRKRKQGIKQLKARKQERQTWKILQNL